MTVFIQTQLDGILIGVDGSTALSSTGTLSIESAYHLHDADKLLLIPNNVFSAWDCKALWKLDNGALTVDSIGTNTLTNSGMASSTGPKIEGDGSAYADSTFDRLYRDDADLDSGFPLKSTESNKIITVCGWFYCTGLPSSDTRHLWGKSDGGTANKRSILVYISSSTKYFSLGIGHTNGTALETVSIETAIDLNKWYHVAVTFDDSDGSYRLRVYDRKTGALWGDVSGNFVNSISLCDINFAIGDCNDSNGAGGYRDEVVVFDRVLSADQIDQIRAGTFTTLTVADAYHLHDADKLLLIPNNVFSAWDCKALWKLNYGALTVDSIGGNTLTNSGVDSVATPKIVGDGSAYSDALLDQLYRSDTDLDSGFPLKSTESNKVLTICGWYRCSGLPAADSRHLWGKFDDTGDKRSILIYIYPSTKYFTLGVGYNSGASLESHSIETEIELTTWYHVAITFDDSDGAYRIRVRDRKTGALFGEATGNFSNNISLEASRFSIGDCNTNDGAGGYRDEVVVFNRVLSADQIDQIAAGTFTTLTVADAYHLLDDNDGSPITVTPVGEDTLSNLDAYHEHVADNIEFNLEGWTDFSEYTISVAPSDWTEYWQTTEFVLDISAGDIGGKKLWFNMTASNHRASCGWDDAGSVMDAEILCKVHWITADGSFNIGGGLRLSGGSGTENGYALWLRGDADELNLRRYVNGAGAELDTDSMTLTYANYYWLRFRVQGDDLKAKCWPDGESEPDSWNIEYTDLTPYSTAGAVGLIDYTQDGWCDFFSYAIGGMTAYSPNLAIDDCYHELDDNDGSPITISEAGALTLANLDSYHLHFADSPNVYSLVPDEAYHLHYVDACNAYSFVINEAYHLHNGENVDPFTLTLYTLDSYHPHQGQNCNITLNVLLNIIEDWLEVYSDPITLGLDSYSDTLGNTGENIGGNVGAATHYCMMWPSKWGGATIEITKAWVVLHHHTTQGRIACYQGGTITTECDASGSDLIYDFGQTSGSDEDTWISITPGETVLLNNAYEPVAFVYKSYDAGNYISTDNQAAGDFEWYCERVSDEAGTPPLDADAATAYPSTFPNPDASTSGGYSLAAYFEVLVTTNATLTVKPGIFYHYADELTLTQRTVVTPEDCYHLHYVDAIPLILPLLLDTECYHLHFVDAIWNPEVIGNDCYHLTDDNDGNPLTLTQTHILSIDEAYHLVVSENIEFDQHFLTTPDTFLLLISDNVALTVNLIVAECYHIHAPPNIDLEQIHILTVAESYHLHDVGGPITITSEFDLIVAECFHLHSSGSLLQLVQLHDLVVEEADSLHYADNIDLVEAHHLQNLDSYHLDIADNVDLVEDHYLTNLDSYHLHSVDKRILLTQLHILDVEETSHILDSAILDLSGIHSLNVGEPYHVLIDDFELGTITMAVGECYHVLDDDLATITQLHILVTEECYHLHYVDQIVFTYLPQGLERTRLISLTPIRRIKSLTPRRSVTRYAA